MDGAGAERAEEARVVGAERFGSGRGGMEGRAGREWRGSGRGGVGRRVGGCTNLAAPPHCAYSSTQSTTSNVPYPIDLVAPNPFFSASTHTVGQNLSGQS